LKTAVRRAPAQTIHPKHMQPLVVENVAKAYRQGSQAVPALHGVSLTVEAGTFVSIMGPSGSGKSTLLHLMAGLTKPDSGRVLVEGSDLGSMNDGTLTRFRRRRIGLIFQAFNLVPTLTARENVALPLMLDGRSGSAEASRVDDLLDRLGMLRRAKHRPDALSGGEQQRIAIGRALVTDPAVILADEPTGNLDSTNSELVCGVLRDLAIEQNRTIVMVTHEPSVAAYTHLTYTLRDGRIADRCVPGEAPSYELRTAS
jgi:putative ABC transport system ATP-binding protein